MPGTTLRCPVTRQSVLAALPGALKHLPCVHAMTEAIAYYHGQSSVPVGAGRLE